MLQIKHLGKTYGTGEQATHAIGDLSFSVEEKEFVCVVGPSGCGKTTLLKCIAGLLPPSTGEVILRGTPVTEPPEEMALVFQEYSRSLFPWMSVRSNVMMPLGHKSLPKTQRDTLVDDALDEVGLSGFTDRYPWQLSGGMQQRVAIARALAYQPSLLLMDEPFASVDAQTRDDLEDLVLQVRKDYGVTILFVTHDIDESVYLADRIIVLTHAPTHVREVVPVDLGPDRDQIATKELAEFARLRTHVYRLIKRDQVQPEPVVRHPIPHSGMRSWYFESATRDNRPRSPSTTYVQGGRNNAHAPGSQAKHDAHGHPAREHARRADAARRRLGRCAKRALATVTVDTLPIANGLPLDLGIAKGFFANHGIEIKKVTLQSGNDIVLRFPVATATSATSAGPPRSSRDTNGIDITVVAASEVEGTIGCGQLAERHRQGLELDPHADRPRGQDDRGQRAQGRRRGRDQRRARQARD